jgi:hypothetical protein
MCVCAWITAVVILCIGGHPGSNIILIYDLFRQILPKGYCTIALDSRVLGQQMRKQHGRKKHFDFCFDG